MKRTRSVRAVELDIVLADEGVTSTGRPLTAQQWDDLEQEYEQAKKKYWRSTPADRKRGDRR